MHLCQPRSHGESAPHLLLRSASDHLLQGKPVIQQSDWWDQESVLHPLTVGAIAFSCLSIYLRFSSARTMSRTNVSKCTALFTFAFRTEFIFSSPDSHLDQQCCHRCDPRSNNHQPGSRPCSRTVIAHSPPDCGLCRDVCHGVQQDGPGALSGTAGALRIQGQGVGGRVSQ